MKKIIIGTLIVLPLIALLVFNSTDSENTLEATPTTTSTEVLDTAPIAIKQAAKKPVHLEKQIVVAKKIKAKKVKLRRVKKEIVKNELHPAPQLIPARVKKLNLDDSKKSLQAQKTPKKDRNFDNPRSNRWLIQNSELAKFNMQKSPEDNGCSNAIEDCVQKRKDQQVTLVGVVVTTDKLSKTPLNSVRGDLNQGHYDNYLPGIYID